MIKRNPPSEPVAVTTRQWSWTSGDAPQVPAKVRTIAYFTMLVASGVGALVTGVVAVWWPDMAPQVGATVAAVLSALGIIAGGLGVAYRPTATGNA